MLCTVLSEHSTMLNISAWTKNTCSQHLFNSLIGPAGVSQQHLLLLRVTAAAAGIMETVKKDFKDCCFHPTVSNLWSRTVWSRGTHKVWLQHSRSLDHSGILLLTAMFTHPLRGNRPASLGLRTPQVNCHTERDAPGKRGVISLFSAGFKSLVFYHFKAFFEPGPSLPHRQLVPLLRPVCSIFPLALKSL